MYLTPRYSAIVTLRMIRIVRTLTVGHAIKLLTVDDESPRRKFWLFVAVPSRLFGTPGHVMISNSKWLSDAQPRRADCSPDKKHRDLEDSTEQASGQGHNLVPKQIVVPGVFPSTGNSRQSRSPLNDYHTEENSEQESRPNKPVTVLEPVAPNFINESQPKRSRDFGAERNESPHLRLGSEQQPKRERAAGSSGGNEFCDSTATARKPVGEKSCRPNGSNKDKANPQPIEAFRNIRNRIHLPLSDHAAAWFVLRQA